MTRLRVSLRVPVGRPLPELATFVARCEDAGFDDLAGGYDMPEAELEAFARVIRPRLGR